MASLASARLDRDAISPERFAPHPIVAELVRERPLARSGYQPSRKAGPLAFVASAAVMLAAMAALATLSVSDRHKPSPRLTVVTMRELDVTPPPPPPKSLDKPAKQPPLAFVPKPLIQLPSEGAKQVMLDAPPPAAPPITQAPQIVAQAGPVAPVAVVRAADPVEGGDLSSEVISAKPPVYPIDARRRRQQGTVKLIVLVGPDGRVSDLSLSASSGSDLLDRAALGAVKHWRWAPQKQAGVPVAVRGYVTIPFVLTS